jgi:serine/threonine protein kinase
MSGDGNLWCEQTDCPAGNTPTVLSYGEFLGDIKIVRLLRLFRTAAVYEAERNEELILLKVAHAGHEEALKQESILFARLAHANQPNLPRLLPAYRQGNVKNHTYGKAVFRNETKYYEVFAYVKGEFLRDSLLQNPQPWYQHAAWITLGVARALAYLYRHGGGLHLNIGPDVLLITEDANGVPIPMLLDLGLIATQSSVDAALMQHAMHHVMPSYLAPELMMNGTPLGQQSDVYGLGLLLFEMLDGMPAYRYRLRSDAEVRSSIRNTGIESVERRDIPQPAKVQELISRATDRNPAARYPNVAALGKELTDIFGPIPAEKRNVFSRISEWSMPAVIGSIVFLLVLILFAAAVRI